MVGGEQEGGHQRYKLPVIDKYEECSAQHDCSHHCCVSQLGQ